MEKTLFISTLKEKANVDNVSERSYDEVAGMFLSQFEDDTKITDESWNLPVQVIKTMSGQLRHDTSEGINAFKTKFENEQKGVIEQAKNDAIAAFKAQWEKDHPDPNKQADDKPDPNAEKSLEERIAAVVAKAMEGVTGEEGSIGKITKQFSEFIAKSEQEKKDAAIAKIREELKSYLLEERMADREPVVNLAIKDLDIKDDSDFDKLKVDAEKKYEKLYKEFYGEGRRPFAGGGGGEDSSTKEFEDFIKEKKAAAQKEADDAAELRKSMM